MGGWGRLTLALPVIRRAPIAAHSPSPGHALRPTPSPPQHPEAPLSSTLRASRALAKDHGPEPHPEARIRPELTPRTGAARHVRSWSTPASAGPLLPPRSAPLTLGVQRVPVRLAPLLEPSHRLGERPHAHEAAASNNNSARARCPGHTSCHSSRPGPASPRGGLQLRLTTEATATTAGRQAGTPTPSDQDRPRPQLSGVGPGRPHVHTCWHAR